MPVQKATADNSINVNGDIRKVFKYVADATNRPSWDPGEHTASWLRPAPLFPAALNSWLHPATAQVTARSGQAAVGVGSKFDLVQVPMPGVKIPIR
jgi:hypothetical protein